MIFLWFSSTCGFQKCDVHFVLFLVPDRAHAAAWSGNGMAGGPHPRGVGGPEKAAQTNPPPPPWITPPPQPRPILHWLCVCVSSKAATPNVTHPHVIRGGGTFRLSTAHVRPEHQRVVVRDAGLPPCFPRISGRSNACNACTALHRPAPCPCPCPCPCPWRHIGGGGGWRRCGRGDVVPVVP